MLARVTPRPPIGDIWAFEYKWDGIRAIARWHRGELTLWGRRGGEITQRYPELRDQIDALLGDRSAVVDGEVMALGDDGRPSFAQLQRRMHVADPARAQRLSRQVPAWYMVFDVMWLDDRSTMSQPYAQRREQLVELGLNRGQWQTPPGSEGDGRAMLDAAADLGIEGIVAKRIDSPYLPGIRSDAWRKVRVGRRQEFVVGGWTPGKGSRTHDIGALLLGYHDKNALRYAGLVGTGFSRQTQQMLLSRLRSMTRSGSPFADAVPRRDATFVDPEIVVEVKFTEWTPDGVLRHPSYLGLREDKDPQDVVRET